MNQTPVKRMRLPLVVIVVGVMVAGFGLLGPPAPFADYPVNVPLNLGDETATVEGGNNSCNILQQRVGWWWWRVIAVTGLDGEWVPGAVGESFCHLSLALGEWSIRLPELPPGTYRVCVMGPDCSEPIRIP